MPQHLPYNVIYLCIFSALAAIEEHEKKKADKLQDEMEEYAQMRKEEKEKEANEIEELKRKRVRSSNFEVKALCPSNFIVMTLCF